MTFNDKFYPTQLEQLLILILKQLDDDEVLGIPKELFFVPKKDDFFKLEYINKKLDSPLGVAAGPQTQLAQNIVIAWLTGARFIELKTVQTLDEIEVLKPCIDMQDEGYNCEWSQELKIKSAFNEYLNAWIIIHILNDKLGYDDLGTIFNLSVGYDLKGIMLPNVQWFLDKMTDAGDLLQQKIELIKDIYPNVKNINIPKQISDNVTLSTMHGCPPEEIEQIANYLLIERKLNTIIKLNPTLLGKNSVAQIIENSGFKTNVPDVAFEHDITFDDAVAMIKRLLIISEEKKLFFGIKLTNTLESTNNKTNFDKSADMMYMSGRALHPISINLVRKIQNYFDGKLTISFSGGADAFNIVDIISCGIKPVTVSSDLLKPGGYGRLAQYYDNLRNNNDDLKNIDELIVKKSINNSNNSRLCSLSNLNDYAKKVLESNLYKKNSFIEPSIKTSRELGKFDCIAAPCETTCPTNQNVPQYMFNVQNGNTADAIRTVFDDNPFPNVTGYVCDHTCQQKCTRINYDETLNIREIKRYIADKSSIDFSPTIIKQNKTAKVGIIGAGPAGLSAAYFLSINGFDVEIFEKNPNSGGMVANAIPSFRLQDEQVDIDVERILNLGAKIHFNYEVNNSNFDDLRNNFEFLFVGAGAQSSLKINLQGIDSKGVLDPLQFFYETRKNTNFNIGKKAAIIGGGNTAMDAARIAKRLVGQDGKVIVLYRRTIEYMPAHYQEIIDTIEEGIEFVELVEPEKIISENGHLKSILLNKTELIDQGNGKRPKPVTVKGSEFEIPLDSLIFAIGQENDFDFLNENDYKNKNIPFTKYDNIFIGGDAVRGAASAIKAVADGKKTAFEIIKKLNPEFKPERFEIDKKISYVDLKVKRAKREFAVGINATPLKNRDNFELVSETYSNEQAKQEADRCLLCDELCDVCVSVCPNLANQGFWIQPFSADLMKIVVENGNINVVFDTTFEITQNRQTYNIADWCNECGNCATFCPTSGNPYLDKPKVHLNQKSFDESPWGYIFENNGNEKIIKYKNNEKLYVLIIKNDVLLFENDEIKAKFDKNFNLLEYEVLNNAKEIKFTEMAQMFVLSHIA